METNKHAGGRPRSMVSMVGKPPKYRHPKDLAKVADDYFNWVDSTPIETSTRKLVGAKQNTKGSEAKSDETKFTAKRAYTLDGFCLFAGITNWTKFKQAECRQSDEYVRVIHAIEMAIRDQQIQGSLAGIFNSNIVARLNGIDENINLKSQAINFTIDEKGREAADELKGK